MRFSCCSPATWLCWAVVAFAADAASAATFYVDNRVGSDGFTGSTAQPLDERVGPFRSLSGALRHAHSGDTIVIANTGLAYHESATLAGERHSALGDYRLVIEGNGAVLDGSDVVPPYAWKELPGRLWRMTPWRKGHYQLILDEAPVPEHSGVRGEQELASVPEGQWAAWQGSIYYRARPEDAPPLQPFRFAREGVGISLFSVHGVTIRNLTLRYYRLDGVSAPHGVSDVVLDRVKLLGNGRAGLAVGGGSEVTLGGSEASGNREHQVLISGLSTVEVVESQLSSPPTIVD